MGTQSHSGDLMGLATQILCAKKAASTNLPHMINPVASAFATQKEGNSTACGGEGPCSMGESFWEANYGGHHGINMATQSYLNSVQGASIPRRRASGRHHVVEDFVPFFYAET